MLRCAFKKYFDDKGWTKSDNVLSIKVTSDDLIGYDVNGGYVYNLIFESERPCSNYLLNARSEDICIRMYGGQPDYKVDILCGDYIATNGDTPSDAVQLIYRGHFGMQN